MVEPKPKLLKSKSSNSANTTRSDSRSNKKSRSSAEFQPVNIKKRGMYVEKKQTKIELNTQTTQLPQRQVKPPPRPRPGKKRFLASVFTILSKSIASTQFPEINVDNIKEEKKIIHKRRHDDNDTEHTQDKKKYKYRSRVLNEHKNDWQKVVVLKQKKDIVQTPSESCNDQESTRWFNLPRLVKQESDDTVESKPKYEDVQVDVATNVTDGRKQKEKRVVIVDNDPTTLVSEETKEKGMYNFFVDLLQTTLSVYNVKPEYDIPSSDASASKVDFMIDEKVAKKLNVAQENKENTPELTDKSQKPVEQQYFIEEETNNWYNRQTPRIKTKPLIPKLEHLKSSSFSRRLKSKSFAGNGIPHSQLPLPRAALTTRPNKKNKKKELLNILKDELRMNYNDFEEPQNLFQALQVIARNKRKCKKSIRFDKSAFKTDNDSGDPECIFKRRNLMSITRKSTKRNKDLLPIIPPRSMSLKHSDINKSYYRKKYIQREHTTDLTDSFHTLEVYGFEIDDPVARQSVSDPKDIILPYRSSTTVGELNFESNETILNFTDSEASYNSPTTGSIALGLN